MNSRIVYPAPSFQPPDTCTEHAECRAGQASNADLCRAAQAHYDKVSTAAHEWHSAIPKAIDAYYADPERERLRDQVIEAAKEFTSNDEARSNWDALAAYRKLCGTVDALLDFESQNKE